MCDKAFIEKIKSLSFNFRPTSTERRAPGFKRVESAEEVYIDSTIPDGYIAKNKNGKDVYIVHGREDKRQVAEIIAAKQGG